MKKCVIDFVEKSALEHCTSVKYYAILHVLDNA